jgi:3-oxoisoapionate kinase
LKTALEHLKAGSSVLLYSALGTADWDNRVDRGKLGVEMGKLLRELLVRSGVKRAAMAGGDTSSAAARQLGVHALTMRAPIAPGAPLCEAHTDDAKLRDLDLVFKGGQVGAEDFFEAVQEGRPE